MNYYISDIHFGNEALLVPQDGNKKERELVLFLQLKK